MSAVIHKQRVMGGVIKSEVFTMLINKHVNGTIKTRIVFRDALSVCVTNRRT